MFYRKHGISISCIKNFKKNGAIGIVLTSVVLTMAVSFLGGIQQPPRGSAAGRQICRTSALLFLAHSLVLRLALVNIFLKNIPRVLLSHFCKFLWHLVLLILLLFRCSIPLSIFVALLWTQSNTSLPCWELQSWTQYSRWGLTYLCAKVTPCWLLCMKNYVILPFSIYM